MNLVPCGYSSSRSGSGERATDNSIVIIHVLIRCTEALRRGPLIIIRLAGANCATRKEDLKRKLAQCGNCRYNTSGFFTGRSPKSNPSAYCMTGLCRTV
jgi:hypothetical protein